MTDIAYLTFEKSGIPALGATESRRIPAILSLAKNRPTIGSPILFLWNAQPLHVTLDLIGPPLAARYLDDLVGSQRFRFDR